MKPEEVTAYENTATEVLNLEELAVYLRLPKETIEWQASQGQIPGQRIENNWRFLKAVIDEWLHGRDSRKILIHQAGVLADDTTLPELRAAIYAERRRPETDE